MKQLLRYYFLLLGIASGISTYSQKPLNPNLAPGYIASKEIKDSKHPYLNLFTTCKGEIIEVIMYLKKEDEYILAHLQGPNIVTEKLIKTDSLFKIIDENLYFLKKLRTYKFHSKSYFIKTKDKKLIHSNQISIRFKDLHFNHFQLEELDIIRNIADSDYQKAYNTLNILKEKLLSHFADL
jgi:hypothetical protein